MENIYFNKKLLNKYTIAANIDFPKLHHLKKIRIGYILKSADVLTLVSRRYSENSSNTLTGRHPRTSADFHTHPCTPAHTAQTRAHKHTPTQTHTHPCTCMYTHTHPQPPTYMYVHLHTHPHTCAHA